MELSELLKITDQTLANEPKVSDAVAAIAGSLSPEDLAAEIRAAHHEAKEAREEPVVPRFPLGHPRGLGSKAVHGTLHHL